MKKLEWVRTHPWIATAFLSGLLGGVILCLPLVPWQLPDSSATLIGSAIGAALAVVGASWVAQGKEERARLLAAKQIASEFQQLEQTFAPIREATNRADPIAFAMMIEPTKLLARNWKITASRVNRMEGLFQLLGAKGFVAFADAESLLKDGIPIASQLADIALNPHLFGVDPQELFRHDAEACLGKIKELGRLIR